MSIHDPKFRLGFTDDDSLDRLVAFLEHNGYQQAPGDGPDVLLTRGNERAGWFSSNMSKLGTELRLRQKEDHTEAKYVVDIRGQRLTDEDQKFWRREINAAEAYALNPDAELKDLRPTEAKRADAITDDLRRKANRVGFAICIGILVLGILATHCGVF